jgi:outer membrane protein OmpA-like peptidoglycan-associated protein
MKHHLPLLVAAALASSLVTLPASAQERGYRRDAPPAATHYGYRHGGYRYAYPRHRYYGAPYRWWGYYAPYWYWAAPAFAYPYPIYEPAPAIVPPAYPPPYYGERVERPVPYRERSYAEAQPSKPAPKAPAAQPVPERYTLSATELFEFDKAELRMPQPKLDEIAAALKANPQVAEVTITGYTDRLGSEAYNLELSMRRAAAVKSYLVGKDVDRDRLKAVGKGEANPIAHCDDTLKRPELIKCLEPNRRVEVERITVERRAH